MLQFSRVIFKVALWKGPRCFPGDNVGGWQQHELAAHLVLLKMKCFLPILDPKTMQTMVRMMTHKKRTERPSLVLLHESPRSPRQSLFMQPSDDLSETSRDRFFEVTTWNFINTKVNLPEILMSGIPEVKKSFSPLMSGRNKSYREIEFLFISVQNSVQHKSLRLENKKPYNFNINPKRNNPRPQKKPRENSNRSIMYGFRVFN